MSKLFWIDMGIVLLIFAGMALAHTLYGML